MSPPFLADRERLEQHRDVGHGLGHDEQVLRPLGESLGAEPVDAVDPAFREAAPQTHVLLAAAAVGAAVGTANARDHRRSGSERSRVARDATEALVTENERVGAVGRTAVVAALDLRVRAAQADAHDVDEDLIVADVRLGHIAHRAGARASRHDRERSHARSIWALWPRY